jgi:threonine dehydrogenase-like Zn-dependent dehydrogenase
MKRILARDGQVALVDVPEPRPGATDVLVQTLHSVVSSGTETHIIRSSVSPEALETDQYPTSQPHGPQLRSRGVRWGGPLPNHAPPGYASLGYSLAGRVLAVGDDVADLEPGDLVACSGNQCAVHAERVAVPRTLVTPIPGGLAPADAAFVTLGSVAIHSLRRASCQFGETVVVMGLGVLGLLAVQVARAAGMYAVGIDPDVERRGLAARLGAEHVVSPENAADVIRLVREVTLGFGADGVLVTAATQSSEPLNLGFDLCRQRGVVVGVGLFGMTIERPRMFGADVAFYPSVAYGPGRYDPVYEEGGVDYPIGYARWTENRNMGAFLRLLREGRVQVGPLAPMHVPLAEASRAYSMLLDEARHPPTVVFDSPVPSRLQESYDQP